MNASDVSAVVVTRGDVSLDEILESLAPVGFHEIYVWANHHPKQWPKELAVGMRIHVAANDLAVYGRYASIRYCRSEFIYVQDDDCIVPAAKLVDLAARYDLASTIVANMPESRWGDYPDSCLVGWGAVFHRDLPQDAFRRFQGAFPSVDHFGEFERECDVVFTVLTDCVKADLGFTHLPWAEDPERAMFLRPWRKAERDRVYEFARHVRDEAS
jgi:hypothetical protein